MLLQSGTSYNIQCVDIRANSIILSAQYTVQGKLLLSLLKIILVTFEELTE